MSLEPALNHLYLDPNLPISERVQDLLSQLTLDEKISQMTNQAAAIPRLGIPAYDFWSEGLHGVARNGRATVFPQAIGMAATWDKDLIEQIASAIADEGRAKYHEALRRHGETRMYQGITFWSPNINIFRDPRWGRGQETWGEDPFLTGELGCAFVRGLQGDHPEYLKAAACAKHFAVHSGPEKDRHTFDARVSQQDLYATYLPAFKKLVAEAGVEAVMGAYNRTNGEPCCASPFLLSKTLRENWGFEGHVVSDCWALTDIHRHHKVTRDAVESAALALNSGCDLSCMCTYDHLGEAIERGLIDEVDIDRALERTLTTRFKLGMFDPPEKVPFTGVPLSVVNSPRHRELAYQAALKSMVLLKNQDNILPVGPQVRSLCLVGPNAASLDVLLANYHGISDRLTTFLEGIVGAVPEGVRVEYRYGCTLNQAHANPINWSIHEAVSADLTIACMGLGPMLEGEEGESVLSKETGDRAEIELPEVQRDYVKALVLAGAKVVLVLSGGSPIALGELEEMVHAVLFTWYPGQEGGRALADLLFGKASPSGKLPLTFPKSTADLPPFNDYSMAERTYRYAKLEPLYPFGFGLSYTRFSYSNLELEAESLPPGKGLDFQILVTNEGKIESDEVVQVYLSALEAPFPAPRASLVAFQRLHLLPGESREISFSLPKESIMLVNEEGIQMTLPGRWQLWVGGCSPHARSAELGAAPLQTIDFRVLTGKQ